MIENAGIDYKELYLQMQSAVVALSKTLEEIQKENKNLKEENEYLKRKLFGTKSETSKSLGFEQLSLFDEAEAEANPDEEQFILEEVKFNKKKKYKQIKLMGVTNNPKKELLSSSINLNTSSYEGFSLSILEANECGVPTLSLDFGESVHEQILNNQTGIIVESKEDYINKLKELMLDEKKLLQLSKNVKEFSNNFHIEKIIDKWLDLFNELDKQ